MPNKIRIATWNVNSLRVRLAQVLQWLQTEQPDVLALQETKLSDENFPITEINDAGYQVVFNGQKTYNGVATISKQATTEVLKKFPDYDDSQRRVLCTNILGINIVNLYIPNGAEVDSDKYRYKLAWLSHLQTFTHQLLQQNKPVILLGDFNIAPEDQDVHDPAAWEGKVLVSPPERSEFQKLINQGLVDSFRLFTQDEKSFSWWDYRMAGFRRNHGMRIDHILASNQLAEKCIACYIDRIPRGWERPSDHTPVLAEFNL